MSIFRTDHVNQRDAWLSAAFLLLLPLLSAVILLPADGTVFSDLPSGVLILIIILVAELIVLGYLTIQYGRVKMSELIPQGLDYLVLFIGILIVFWSYSLAVGRGGLRVELYDSIRDLDALPYSLTMAVLVIIGPFLEETFFRRYFFEILRHYYPIGWAIAFTVGVATLFHIGGSFVSLIWSCFFQAIFTIAYIKSRLATSWLIHSFVNALTLLLAR